MPSPKAVLSKPWAYAAVITATALWGFGFVFGKIALAGMPVSAMVTYRFATAAIVLLPALFLRRVRLARRDMLLFAIAGIFYVPVQFLLQFEGLALTSLSHASLVVALLPALIALGSVFYSRAAPRPNWAAIAASAVGATFIVLRPGGNASIGGDVLVVVSLAAAVVWVLMSERFNRRFDPIGSSALILVFGTAALVLTELVLHPAELAGHYSRAAWFATIACGVFSTALTTVIWNVGLKTVPAADAGVFINLEPLIGAVCGVILFGDVLGWPAAAGGALIVAGAVAVTRGGAQNATAAAPAAAVPELDRIAG